MTAAGVKVFSFDMYMPSQGENSLFTDYFNQSSSFTGFYQITIKTGGKQLLFVQIGAASSGVLEGYYIGVSNGSNNASQDNFSDTTLMFDKWYRISFEIVFDKDESGEYTVPMLVNVYADGRYVGTSDIFYDKDGTSAKENYPATATKSFTLHISAMMRNMAVGYFDDPEYYEN